MALVKCTECNEQISDKATACPKCGIKIRKTSATAWLALVLVCVFTVMLISNSGKHPSGPSEASKQLAWMEQGENLVKAKLKDPGSAVFNDVFFSRGTANIPAACGRVNAKNTFGGYLGFQRFISVGEAGGTYMESEVSGFQELWDKMCTR